LKGEGEENDLWLYMRNPIEVLKELIWNNGDDGEFAYFFNPKYDDNGHRTYSTPQTADWWKEMDAILNFVGASVAALIIYSDQTTLSNDWRVSGWPVILTLANIALKKRRLLKGHSMIALLPILQVQTGKEKLQIFHRAKNFIVSSLREASHT
jgi:Plavaka transposase